MNRIRTLNCMLMIAVFVAGMTACASTHKLPILEGKEIVAVVNGEPITREEYEDEILSLHSGMSEDAQHGQQGAGKGAVDYSGLLERIVNTRLILQEARNIGLNELPEVRELLDANAAQTLRITLMKEHAKDAQPDADVVERLYRDEIEEWKFASVLFKKEEDARTMEERIKAGGNFDELTEKAMAAGEAKGGKAGEYFKGEAILPPIRTALAAMKTGEMSTVIPVGKGFALVKLEDVRYPDSPEKREEARKRALQIKRGEVLRKFIDALKQKYATVHEDVLEGLDFGKTMEEFEQYLKDERAVVDIEGEAPITVAQLADELRQKYFHGVERAIEKQGLNKKKFQALDVMLDKRVLTKEANKQDIANTDAYKMAVSHYENAVVFGVFVKKVIEPDVKIMESEIKNYYDEHPSEFTSPEMMKLDSITFVKREDAEEAMQKLREGDQLSWLKSHAAGQADKDAKGSLALDGGVVASSELPAGVKSLLSGAGPGDFRLYEGAEGLFSVVSIMAIYPQETQDYVSVRPEIAGKLYNERLQAGVSSWTEKLRAAADIKIYMKN